MANVGLIAGCAITHEIIWNRKYWFHHQDIAVHSYPLLQYRKPTTEPSFLESTSDIAAGTGFFMYRCIAETLLKSITNTRLYYF